MFLDEKLLQMCKDGMDTGEDIQKLYSDLCIECGSYYKNNMHNSMTRSELKTLLNKTFNLWDSFVRMAKKSGGITEIFGGICERNTFKSQFLSGPELSRIYNSL